MIAVLKFQRIFYPLASKTRRWPHGSGYAAYAWLDRAININATIA